MHNQTESDLRAEIPLARDEALEQAQAARKQTADRLRANGGNVALTARQLRMKKDKVKRIRDAFKIPRLRGTGERVYGPRLIERCAVEAALKANGGNVKRTVRETGVPETTVRRWRGQLYA